MFDEAKKHFFQQLTQAEWRKRLSPMAFAVLREGKTEHPFSGQYDQHFMTGIYVCAGCQTPLFMSRDKFDAGCGWPSFSQESAPIAIEQKNDTSHGMQRIEILCPVCGGHLGHVFDDGPLPTRQRYCVNSAALEFRESDE